MVTVKSILDEHEHINDVGKQLSINITDYIEQLLENYTDCLVVELEHILVGSIINCCNNERSRRSNSMVKRKNQIYP